MHNRNTSAQIWLSGGLLCVAVAMFAGLSLLADHATEITAYACKKAATYTETETYTYKETKTEADGTKYERGMVAHKDLDIHG